MMTDRNSKVCKQRISQYVAALSACLGSVCTGAVEGWTGNISEDMKALSFNGIPITEDRLGVIGSLSTVGCICSCLPSALLSNCLGRRKAILLFLLPLLLGWLLIIFAQKFWMLALGRFLCGLTDGAYFTLVPMYVAEIAQKNLRGRLTGYFDFFLTVGIFLAFIVGNFLNMRHYTIVMACFPLVFGLLFFFQPESPIFLAMRRRERDAFRSLQRLRADYCDVVDEMQEIKVFIAQNDGKSGSIMRALRETSVQRAMLICFPLMLMQQGGGITVITFYTSTIFAATNVDLSEKLSTIIIGIVSMFSAFLTTLLIDKLGRRTLLITSNVGSSLSMALLALFFTLQDRQIVPESTLAAIDFLPILSVSLFATAYSLGNGTIPWLLFSELFLPEVKSFALGCGAFVNLTAWWAIARYYFELKNALSYDVTFYVFAIFNLLAAVFVYFTVPETNGKSFAEIQTQLKSKNHVWQCGR